MEVLIAAPEHEHVVSSLIGIYELTDLKNFLPKDILAKIYCERLHRSFAVLAKHDAEFIGILCASILSHRAEAGCLYVAKGAPASTALALIRTAAREGKRMGAERVTINVSPAVAAKHGDVYTHLGFSAEYIVCTADIDCIIKE